MDMFDDPDDKVKNLIFNLINVHYNVLDDCAPVKTSTVKKNGFPL